MKIKIALAILVVALFAAACAPTPTPAPTAVPPTATSAATATPAPTATSAPPIVLRFSSIVNASQSYIPVLMMEKGIGKKYGLDIQLIPLSTTGQQWTSMRAGDADISSGSVLDLLRQRQAGLKAKAIRGFSTFGNAILAPPDKPFSKLSDLKGVRVGTPSAILLDWMILRAAGLKSENFDIGKDTQVSESSPPLLNQLMLRGQLDAALQFAPDFALQPTTEGTLKVVTTVPQVMAKAGFDPQVFYLTYNLTDAWREKYPDGAARIVAAMDEAVELMDKDDSIWPALAKRSGVEDPKLLPSFIAAQRGAFKTTFSKDKLAPTQALFDELVKIVGPETMGVTKVDPDAFDFDAADAAKKLRR